MSNFQKNSKDYGEPDITYQLAGFKKTVRIMENPTLPTNWLAALSNANHDGTKLQIDDAVEISSKTYRHQASSRRDDETGATEH